ncbi:MAG: biopolymer transporter ExbD [Bacteroidetes bacterium]|mgnify:CR=1 FL=1|nr:biopolymer transporter ExbD [Bacteroidota bacterium]
MALKKRSKISAEFSMSSLTDIIFLLLIFFMLTSTLVKIEAVDLPESDSKTVAPVSVAVMLYQTGVYKIESIEVEEEQLENTLRRKYEEAGSKPEFTLTIVAEKGTPFERVVRLMTLAEKMKVKAILATQPKKS